jgi:hypothetical protein
VGHLVIVGGSLATYIKLMSHQGQVLQQTLKLVACGSQNSIIIVADMAFLI